MESGRRIFEGRYRMTENRDMIREIVRIIKSNVEVELIYIFGSYGTERYNSESDIDIAFSAKKEVSKEVMRKLWYELVENLSQEVDLIDINNCGLIIKKEILLKGRLIFESEMYLSEKMKYKTYSLYGQYLEDVSVVKDKIKERGRILCKK